MGQKIELVELKVELEPDVAWALAQFMKRVGWQEWRRNAVDDEEAAVMRTACGKLQQALANVGYAPR